MDESVLQEIGFTRAESIVYLSLLKLGAVKVGKIIKESGLQSSTVHNVLHSLIEKGFVNYIIKGKMKIYNSTDPSLILESLKEKEKSFEKILPRLKMFNSYSSPYAEIYEGTKGMMNMLNELIMDAKPGDIYYFFAVDVKGMNKEIQDFFRKYDAKRREKKLIVKGIARKELKTLFKRRRYLKVKYVDFPIPSNISICNDKMIMINWTDNPIGILIKSEQIIENHKNFFNSIYSSI